MTNILLITANELQMKKFLCRYQLSVNFDEHLIENFLSIDFRQINQNSQHSAK